MNSEATKSLLSIVELGGYPDFSALYHACGFTVDKVSGMRKALSLLKKGNYKAVVCEFNFQSDFRDRTSSLESMMAVLQRKAEIAVIVFYEEEYEHQFQKIQARFPIHAALKFPVDDTHLRQALLSVSG